MNRLLLPFCLVSLLMFISCSNRPCAESRPPSSDFKMIIRLWPDHHSDTVLRNELIAALKRNRKSCDEVWFCTDMTFPPSMDVHRKAAGEIAVAAAMMRAEGIESSIQIGTTIGHGDAFWSEGGSLPWGTVIDSRGVKTTQCSCPRQVAFLQYLEEMSHCYAAASKPNIVWMDDDLRVTMHDPARELCFCETCITLFNKKSGGKWVRTTLVEALDRAPEGSTLRSELIAFHSESIALVAEAVAKGVHAASPSTRVGLQHYNGHADLLNGWDWNPIFESAFCETNAPPTSRPGNGFYNDHAPRGMFEKGYNMAIQVARLPEYVSEIAAEVEGYKHWATGKSAYGMAVESFFYLGMGCTQLSYAIICSAAEPMEWYETNYFNTLSRWRPFYEDYRGYHISTRLAGVYPYISRLQHNRPLSNGEPSFAWAKSKAGNKAALLAPLGLPIAAGEEEVHCVKLIDAASLVGIPDEELLALTTKGGIVFENQCFERVSALVALAEEKVAGCLPSKLYQAEGGLVAFASFDPSVSNKERLALIQTFDHVGRNRLPIIMETSAQMVLFPRIDQAGLLKSVGVINASIGGQSPVELRLRGVDSNSQPMWITPLSPPVPLSVRFENREALITLPEMDGWGVGWIKI